MRIFLFIVLFVSACFAQPCKYRKLSNSALQDEVATMVKELSKPSPAMLDDADCLYSIIAAREGIHAADDVFKVDFPAALKQLQAMAKKLPAKDEVNNWSKPVPK